MLRIINQYDTVRQKIAKVVETRTPGIYDKYLITKRKGIDFFNHEKDRQTALDTLNSESLFNLVLIETINKCNSACSFCQANKFKRTSTRPEMMKDELFYSIIDQLGDMDYRGHIRPFGYGEPLMDPRMPEFLRYIKKKLPHAIKNIYTNGILFTPELFLEIIESLDWIHINNYNDDLVLNPEIQVLYDRFKDDPSIKCDVQIHLRKVTQMLTNRAGNTSNRSQLSKPLQSPCMFLYNQVPVRSDGKVSMCFLDVQGSTTVGDLNKQSLLEVWYSESFKKIKLDVILKGRGANSLCRICDA